METARTHTESPELNHRYQELLERVKVNNPNFDQQSLRDAYDFAAEAHQDQKRKDGSPFVTHPLAVAMIVANMGLDLESVMAALLHDTVEDTGCTVEQIKSRFGAPVALLVDGVTKLTRVSYTSKEDEQMENLRKMFLAMARDIRVILIKIADRLHNMQTMAYQSEDKQREKALETMEIYAPIAHRLGMQRMKWELEDLSLKYLDPIGYEEITDELSRRSQSHEEFLEHVQGRISERLEEMNIRAYVVGRVKHVYSIYRKMMSQHKSMFEIYDLYAVRVIVDREVDCYNVLGYIHDLYKPIPGRFKDYISTPKPNMYQSLHTTVIGREGMPFEVQIRTWDMNQMAEYGIAAHWKYKQGVGGSIKLDQKLEWVRRLLETQQDTDPEEFISGLKIDMFADEVYVFTPMGDVINLPAGATPIDFAYAIHSAVGNRMSGVKVNGRMTTFDYQLQNGDIIEVITSGSSHGPSRDWIKLAKTSEARNKIKQWFKSERREENIAHGRDEFERELRRSGIPMATIQQEEIQPQLLRRLSFKTMEELYGAIGYGGITATRAINRMRDELVRISRSKAAPENDEQAALKLIHEQPKKQPQSESGVIVQGIENCLVKFARCCTPVPGDPICGFVTRGFGVSIHHQACINAMGRKNPEERDRWVEVRWASSPRENYQTSLMISAREREGLVMDIATVLGTIKVPLRNFQARSLGDGFSIINMSIEVHDLDQLEKILTRLGQVAGVIEVSRHEIA